MASATCEGTADVAANCMGQCEATCQGECKGTCISPDGKRTENDPNCRGKCSSGCNGLCRGRCKVEAVAGINCGASVSCKGGCVGTLSQPKCESTFNPPVCVVDNTCYTSCSSRVHANPVCEPPTVQLFADVNAGPDAAKLVASINKHLPGVISVVDTDGEIVVKAIEKLVVTGQEVVNASGDLDGKSIACATAAAKAAFNAEATLHASVTGSVQVADTCKSRAL
jgi:hypothetical protein